MLPMLAASIGIAALCLFAASSMHECASSSAGETKSTPQSEWLQGTMPYLYQTDPAWAKHPYAETSFGESGCGPTSLAMVYIFLTGDRSVSPTDIADLAESFGCSSIEGTSWSFMTSGASALGLQSEHIVLDEATVQSHLDAGRPIICIMGEGDFTTSGHFIVLCGSTEDGLINVRDSNSPERSAKAWSLQIILQQYQSAWVYRTEPVE